MWQALTIMTIASALAIFLFPQIGIRADVLTAHGRQSWVGVFGGKNGLGHYMALAVITYTFTHLEGVTAQRGYRIVNLALLVLAGFLLAMSESPHRNSWCWLAR